MDKDKTPMPGAPPPTPKPIKSEEKLTFCYADLLLEDAYYVDNRMYLRFFVDAKDPYFVDISKAEFMEFQSVYFSLFEIAMSEETCACDKVIPKLTELDTKDLTMIINNPETSETIEEIVKVKIYLAEAIVEGLQVGIHSPEEHNQD